MSRKPNKLNKVVENYFQCFLLSELYTEVKLTAGNSTIAVQAGASRCRIKDELEGAESLMLSVMTLSKNIVPLPYPNWYVVRYQDERGKLMLTCLPLSEETAKKMKKDGRYLPELSEKDIARAELLASEKGRWNIVKGHLSAYVIDTLLRGAEVPKLYLDLTPTFNFVEIPREEVEESIKEAVKKVSNNAILLPPAEMDALQALALRAVAKEKEATPSAPVKEVPKPTINTLNEGLKEVGVSEPLLSIREAREILREEGMYAPEVTVIAEPKEEYPDLKGTSLTVSDHATKRWLGRIRKDETTQINHKVRREVHKEISKHFLTAVKVFGEGINDERTSYYLDKQNVIYVFGEEDKSIITLYPIKYGFDPSVDRLALLAQIKVIKEHYSKYHESQKTVRKGLERAKSEKALIQGEIDTLKAQLAEYEAKKAEIDASIIRIPLESNTHLLRYTKEFNKVFRKNTTGVTYDK